jgi:protein TonB
MSATTVNSFPAMNSYASPRGAAMAFIALLHLAFFFALSSGLGVKISKSPLPPFKLVPTPTDARPPDEAPKIPLPDLTPPRFHRDPPTAPPVDILEQPPTPPDIVIGGAEPLRREAPHAPVISAPEEDQHHPLSSPAYPPAEIRANHAGVVILRVQVLEDGRIGNIEVAHSSGYARLDESAMREARHWRMKPGTRDGIPVVMWKEVPITFQLKDRGMTDF